MFESGYILIPMDVDEEGIPKEWNCFIVFSDFYCILLNVNKNRSHVLNLVVCTTLAAVSWNFALCTVNYLINHSPPFHTTFCLHTTRLFTSSPPTQHSCSIPQEWLHPFLPQTKLVQNHRSGYNPTPPPTPTTETNLVPYHRSGYTMPSPYYKPEPHLVQEWQHCVLV